MKTIELIIHFAFKSVTVHVIKYKQQNFKQQYFYPAIVKLTKFDCRNLPRNAMNMQILKLEL